VKFIKKIRGGCGGGTPPRGIHNREDGKGGRGKGKGERGKGRDFGKGLCLGVLGNDLVRDVLRIDSALKRQVHAY
jgi:hypothetical protein